MQDRKSYYCGNGNEFFGNEYSKRLEEAYNGVLNYKDFNYQIVYSLNAVHNVTIVPPKPFNEQIFYKNEFISKKENLAQVWFEKNNPINEFHSISDYCYLKLLELYPEQSKRFGGPSFSLTIYDKGCFIENHKDGDDDDKSRLCVVLLYLNKDWKPGMGGELIITDEHGNKLEITPEFGNFAILDFQNYNLYHEVKPITDDNFHRKTLISFIHLAK